METYIIFFITAFVVITFLLAFYVFIKAGGKKLSIAHKKFIKKQWDKIIDESLKGNIHGAILNADKLLGYTLKVKGIHGSVGEQLKKSGGLFKSIDNTWAAHKMRNKIAHEINVKITEKEGERILRYFKNALNDLGAEL